MAAVLKKKEKGRRLILSYLCTNVGTIKGRVSKSDFSLSANGYVVKNRTGFNSFLCYFEVM